MVAGPRRGGGEEMAADLSRSADLDEEPLEAAVALDERRGRGQRSVTGTR